MNKMNISQYAVALIVLASNAGCSFGFVATDLAPSVPPLEYWKKNGATPEQRLQDSIECGGGNSVYVQFTPQALKDERRPDESELVASRRLYFKWRDCMLNKNYYYTESVSSHKVPDKAVDSSRQVVKEALKPELAAPIK